MQVFGSPYACAGIFRQQIFGEPQQARRSRIARHQQQFTCVCGDEGRINRSDVSGRAYYRDPRAAQGNSLLHRCAPQCLQPHSDRQCVAGGQSDAVYLDTAAVRSHDGRITTQPDDMASIVPRHRHRMLDLFFHPTGIAGAHRIHHLRRGEVQTVVAEMDAVSSSGLHVDLVK